MIEDLTDSKDTLKYRAFLEHLFRAAVAAVDPIIALPPYLPMRPRGRTIVIGAGKASARMALALERHWRTPVSGLVITRYGHGEPCQHIEVIEAGHPVPDDAGYAATVRIFNMVENLSADDLVICLMSGGGSSLLSMPAPGLSLEEKREVNRALLKSGASIAQINCVRRHLSGVKGGRLALACYPAQVVTLVVSDVPGDDPAIVASGPTVPDSTTDEDALAILRQFAIPISPTLASVLSASQKTTPTPQDKRLNRNHTVVIASAQQALEAASAAAQDAGYSTLILSNSMEGEAREVALVHAGIARQVVLFDQPLSKPCVVLSGGETSVTVRGQGRGGRNTEFLLALAIGLNGLKNVYAIACDTDGIDGTEDNAGGVVLPDTLTRAEAIDLHAKSFLADNNSYEFFSQLNDLLVTGPTRTNVNDFRAILIV